MEFAEDADQGSADGRTAGSDVLLDVEVDDVRCMLVASEPPAARPNPNPMLSPREEQIARMVAEGYPNKTIAAMLKISSWTVSTYLRRIFVKLDVHSRTAMVKRLFEEDMIAETPDPGPPQPWRLAPEAATSGGPARRRLGRRG